MTLSIFYMSNVSDSTRTAALRRGFMAAFLVVALVSQTVAVSLPVVAPAMVGMSAERLARMDAAIEGSIKGRELPGAVVLVGRRGRVAWRKAYGARAVSPAREAMTTDTVFDLASLTKVVATATSIMILIERGQVRLSDPLARFLPELKGGERERITIEQLLTHRAGFAPDFDLSQTWTGYDEAIKRLANETLRSQPGTRFVYSDLGYIALGEVVRRVSGARLDEFAAKNIFAPLGMRDTGFRPQATLHARIAPTEQRSGQASSLGGKAADAGAEGARWLRGACPRLGHDEQFFVEPRRSVSAGFIRAHGFDRHVFVD